MIKNPKHLESGFPRERLKVVSELTINRDLSEKDIAERTDPELLDALGELTASIDEIANTGKTPPAARLWKIAGYIAATIFGALLAVSTDLAQPWLVHHYPWLVPPETEFPVTQSLCGPEGQDPRAPNGWRVDLIGDNLMPPAAN